jgi:hypothetical protein
MRLRPVLASSVLVAALLVVGPLAPGSASGHAAVDDAPLAVADLTLAVDGPLPRLGERGPAEGAPDGLAIAPAITEVRPAPGRRTELVHVVTNGTDAPLDLTIDVPTAPLGRHGPRVEVLDDPPVPVRSDAELARLVAPTEQLILPAGHGAELRSTAETTEGASAIFGLRATGPDGDAAIAWVVIADAGLATDLDVRLHGPHDLDDDAEDPSLAVFEVTALRHAVVDVRVRVRNWTGVLQDLTLNDLLIGPEGPRAVAIDRPASALPGPLTVEAVAVSRDGEEARAELDADAGITPTLIAGALVVLALLAITLLGRRRHLRSDGRTGTAPPASSPHDPTDPRAPTEPHDPTEEPTP